MRQDSDEHANHKRQDQFDRLTHRKNPNEREAPVDGNRYAKHREAKHQRSFLVDVRFS